MCGKVFWVGSLYLSTGVPNDEYELEIEDVLKKLPATDNPVIVAGDFNKQFGWAKDGDESVSLASSSKITALKTKMSARRITLVPQEDATARTFISRKDPSTGGQIDAFFSSWAGRCSSTERQECF